MSVPETPLDSPLQMGDVLGSPVYRDLMTAKLAPGDRAFLFELPAADGSIVRLADLVVERPVALVFGSFT